MAQARVLSTLSRPGFARGSFESRHQGRFAKRDVVALFGFGRREVADRLQQSTTVGPVDPGQRGKLNGFEGSPGPAPMYQFSLVEPVDRLGEGVVIAVADAADRGLDTRLGQAVYRTLTY